MSFFNSPFFGIFLFSLLVAIILVIFIKEYKRMLKPSFIPDFERTGDGGRMIFPGFDSKNAFFKKDFHKQYFVGGTVSHEGRTYEVVKVYEIEDDTEIPTHKRVLPGKNRVKLVLDLVEKSA